MEMMGSPKVRRLALRALRDILIVGATLVVLAVVWFVLAVGSLEF